MKTCCIYGSPPPKPKHYPATIYVRGVCNHLMKYEVENEGQYYALVFWRWRCRPAGHSINSPLQRDVDGGDLQVKGQT